MGKPLRSRLLCVVIAAVAAFGMTVAAQTGVSTEAGSLPARPSGLLAGQVVDAVTGKPVAGVSMSIGGGGGASFSYAIGPTGQPISGGPGRQQSPTGAPRQVLTDSDGRFVFHDLPKGNYVLRTPAAPGYLVGGYGQNRPYGPVQPISLSTDDTKIGDLKIRIWRTSVLGGTIVDETGEPMVAVNVTVFRRTMANGMMRLAGANSGSTDDRGVYRIPSMGPGEYLVAVMSSMTTMPTSTAEAYAQAMGSGASFTSSDLYRSLMSSGAPFPSLGGYRVGDLAVSTSAGGLGALQPAPAESGKVFVYPTTFYPAARFASQATVIKLGAGEDRSSIDLQLKLVPAVRVAGMVNSPDGPMPNIGVKLYSADSDSVTGFTQNPESASTTTDASGAFTFLGVPSGEYTVKVFRVPRPPATNSMPSNMTMIEVAGPGGTMMGMATSGPGAVSPLPPPIPAEPTLSATLPVTVGENDVTGLSVALRAGPHLSGRLQFDGSREPPTPAQLQRALVQVSPLEVRQFNANPVVRVDADGRFTTGGFIPGRDQITGTVIVGPGAPGAAPAPAWTFKSATLNGRNLTDDPLDIGSEDISGIVIAFTDRTTQITGAVTDQQGQTDKTAEVIAFPADAQSWRQGVSNTRRIRVARASLSGIYEFSGLPPGEYFLAAVAGDTPVDVLDPQFLQSLATGAARVTLSDGDKQTRDMQVKTIR